MAENTAGPRRYQWDRVWLPVDKTISLGVQGFLSPPAGWGMSVGEPMPRLLRELEPIFYLLLRGPSGAGKTTEMQVEAERLTATGRATGWIDLASFSNLPSAELRKAASKRGSTVFIDGLDLAMISNPTLPDELGRLITDLGSKPGGGVSFRIAVRSGVRCDGLANTLRRISGEKAAELTLAPLSVADIRRAARAEGLDPTNFVSYVKAVRAGPLATQPPTLRMLLKLQLAGKEPSIRRDELYEAGTRVMVKEVEAARVSRGGGDQRQFVGELEADERLAVAARVAALMVFGGKTVIDFVGDVEGALIADAAIGGDEPVGEARVQVRRPSLREIVRTGLFRSDGGDRYAFAHPSFMEFLAARFVGKRQLGITQIMSLIEAPSQNGTRRVAANRMDVASWIAAANDEVFNLLADRDPQVVLRSGVPPRSRQARRRLADGLLAANAAGDLDLAELEASGDLVLISHGGLYDKLSTRVLNRDLPITERQFALGMIEYCGDAVPSRELLSLAVDRTEVPSLRQRALAELRHTLLEEVRDEIVAVAAGGFAQDPNGELRASALQLIHRTLVSSEAVIRMLVPCHDGKHSEAYQNLCLHLLRSLEADELPDVLGALAEVLRDRRWSSNDIRNLVLLVSGLAKRAFAQLSRPAVRTALASLILVIPDSMDWAPWSDTLHNRGMSPDATPNLRRELMIEIASRAHDPSIAKVLLEAAFLVRHEELDWAMREALSLPDSVARSVLSSIAVEIARHGTRRSPLSALRDAGIDAAAAREVARCATRMPRMFDRWRPPRWFLDKQAETSGDEAEAQDADEESLLETWSDIQLQRLREAAPGRAPVPPVEAATMLALADNSDARLIRSDRDLADVVIDSLARAQLRLKGQTPMVRSLWNEASEAATPKEEGFLSDFVADHLRIDLVGRAIAADREVEIRPKIAETQGQRTDIRVQAFSKASSGARRLKIASVTIEVKGCWNADLFTAMKEQLRDRYMATTGEAAGLFLVGCYFCKRWKAPKVAGLVEHDPAALVSISKRLRHQARELSAPGREVGVFMLDVGLA